VYEGVKKKRSTKKETPGSHGPGWSRNGHPSSSELRENVDAWAAGQIDEPGRSEAIRRLVEMGLASARRAEVRSKRAATASEMAGQEIDRLGDPSATDEERQIRKRRLLKGPKSFAKFAIVQKGKADNRGPT
jgi:hypothetical protein